jgi:hypothetical protein
METNMERKTIIINGTKRDTIKIVGHTVTLPQNDIFPFSLFVVNNGNDYEFHYEVPSFGSRPTVNDIRKALNIDATVKLWFEKDASDKGDGVGDDWIEIEDDNKLVTLGEEPKSEEESEESEYEELSDHN